MGGGAPGVPGGFLRMQVLKFPGKTGMIPGRTQVPAALYRACISARGPPPVGIHNASLLFKFQMHTAEKIVLKMFCFSCFQHVSFFSPTMLERRTVCHIFSKFSPY